ncbi:MAG: hypothetical protein M1825_002644 [Sarcosagium campestre]|nr:MAG: hypothetical protein M1825_002644 [Sarcosagium campestre]
MATSKVFSLEGQGLKLDTADDIEPYLKPLLLEDVKEIRLAGNTLGVEACKRLAQVVCSKKSLQIANLADIFTSRLLTEIPPALEALVDAFLQLPSLHTVNLSDNAFGLNTVTPLVTFLSQHAPLRHLILNNNGLGPRAGVLVGDALTKLQAKKTEARLSDPSIPDLETVICGRNRLENGSMEAWARAFATHTKVKEVKMVQNGIRQEGISLLLRDGLRHNPHLEVLDLQDNTFTTLASRALTEVVPGWSNLHELGVGDCLLSPRGGILAADALAKGKNTQLHTLRLQYNDIDTKGLARFTHAAKEALPALRRIELNGNKFSEDDPSVTLLKELLETRKEERGQDDDEDLWGLDSLSDLEEDDSEDEDEDEDEDEEQRQEEQEETDEKAERILRDADKAENEKVAQEEDKQVDELADKLGKTDI